MKKLFTAFLFITGFAFASHAQEATHSRQERKEQIIKAKEELSLSEEQQKKWNDIDEDFKTQIKTIRKNEGLDKEEKKKQLRSLSKEKMEKINAVLTTDQREKWNQMRKEAHHKKGLKQEPVSK
jgi:protein CpxP